MSSKATVSIIIPTHDAAGYIINTIKNLKSQTLTSWECLFIDYTAEEDTGKTIEELVSGDKRFAVIKAGEENRLGALNRGLEAASGKYVMFCDDDGLFTENGLEEVYNEAFRKKADIAISGASFVQGAEEKLSLLEPQMTSDMSLKGKLFRREFLNNNDMSFGELLCGEETRFFLEAVSKSSCIYGFREKIYGTIGMIPETDKEIGVDKDKKLIDDAVNALEVSIEIAEKRYEGLCSAMRDKNSAEAGEAANQIEKFKSNIYLEFVRNVLIGKIYRHAWLAGDELLEKAYSLMKKYQEKIFPHDWDLMLRKEKETLRFDGNMLMLKDDINKSPMIAFAISDMSPDKIDPLVRDLYNQGFPFFEILIQGNLLDALDPAWKSMPNIVPVDTGSADFKNEAYKSCRADCLWFVDKPVKFLSSTVSEMYGSMREWLGVLFVSAPIFVSDQDGIKELESNQVAFLPEFAKQKRRTAYNQMDFIWVNKLISKVKLDAMKDPFGQGDRETLERFYKNSRYRKEPDIHIIADITDSDILAQVESPAVKALWKQKLKKDRHFQELAYNREHYKPTVKGKTKGVRNRTIKALTTKVVYPFIYHSFSLLPVNKKKVIFLEPTKLKITDSLENIERAVLKDGNYDVREIFIGKTVLRKREVIKREIHFLREMATARYVFLDEAFNTIGGFNKRKGTTVVQLWHGCGAFKQFGFSTADLIFGGNMQEQLKYLEYRNLDMITVSSPEVAWAYEEAMGYKGTDVVKATGISRTDVFFDEDFVQSAKKKIYDSLPELGERKLILYAPTFRGRIKKAKGPDKLDIPAMKEALGDEYFLLIKHHPHVKVPPSIPEDCKDFACMAAKDMTIEDLICSADICISDYSSLIFEYSLLEKPMIFFAYDLEKYDDWRGFYYDYDELTPGPIVYTTNEIIKYIKNIEIEFDKDEVIRFREKFMSACDGHATERILETIGLELKNN